MGFRPSKVANAAMSKHLRLETGLDYIVQAKHISSALAHIDNEKSIFFPSEKSIFALKGNRYIVSQFDIRFARE